MSEVQTRLPSVLTIRDCAADLQLSREAVYRAVRAGEIPSLKIGSRILIPRDRYQRLLNGDVEVA